MTDETAAESVALDRVANALGLSTEQPQVEGTQVEAEPELAELEWDGIKFSVPVKAKDAFMQREDYTRKTQELAGQRRDVEHIREAAQQVELQRAFTDSIGPEAKELSVIDAYLEQATKVNWAAMSTEQILRAKVEIDNVKERRDVLRAAVDQKRSAYHEQAKAKISELRGKSREIASKAIPGFNEETEKSVRAFALTEGLAEQEIDSVLLDPRSYRVLWKAMQYDKIKAGASKSTKAVETALRPGVAGERMPAATAAKLNYNKAMKSATTSGQKAVVIEQRLQGVFGK